jgi:hypothetical protein
VFDQILFICDLFLHDLEYFSIQFLLYIDYSIMTLSDADSLESTCNTVIGLFFEQFNKDYISPCGNTVIGLFFEQFNKDY